MGKLQTENRGVPSFIAHTAASSCDSQVTMIKPMSGCASLKIFMREQSARSRQHSGPLMPGDLRVRRAEIRRKEMETASPCDSLEFAGY